MIIKNFINGQITTGTEPIDPISGVSRGLYINSVLSGNSTSDTLVGLDINPSYSGIAGNYFGLRVSGDTIFATTGGTQVFNTSSKDSAVIVGSVDFGAYFQVTSKSRTASPGRSSAEFVIGNYNDSKFSLFSYDGASAWTERFRLVGQTGNVLIGTTTDAGFKLDVNGDTRIKGAGATSGTTGFTVVNSSNEVALQVLNNKWIGMQVLSPSAPLHVYYPGTTPQTKTIAIFDGYQSPAQPEMQIQVGTVTNNFASFFGHKTDMGGFVKTIASSTFAITWDNTSNLGFGGSPVANNTVTIYPRNFSNTSEINTTGAILRVATGSIQIVPQTATPDTSMVGLGIITLNSNVIAKTYTNAINLYIDGPPVAGNNTTITNRWSMYVNSGNTYFGGRVMVGLTGDTGFQFTSSGSTLLRGSGTTSSSSALTVQNSSGGTLLNLTNNGNLNVDNGTLYVDGDNGRVGVGTTSPTNPLDIAFTPGRFISFQAVPGYADSGQIVFSNATSAGIVSSGTIGLGPGDTNKTVTLGNGITSKITTPGSTKYDCYGNQTPSTLAGTTNRPVLFTSTIADGCIDGFIFENTSSGSKNLFKVIQDNTTLLTLNPNGNFFLGTTTDLGFKLSVSGSTLLRGSGTTSASYALATQNSSGGTTMVVNNAGNMLIGTTTDAGYRLDVNGAVRTGDLTVGASGQGQIIAGQFDFYYPNTLRYQSAYYFTIVPHTAGTTQSTGGYVAIKADTIQLLHDNYFSIASGTLVNSGDSVKLKRGTNLGHLPLYLSIEGADAAGYNYGTRSGSVLIYPGEQSFDNGYGSVVLAHNGINERGSVLIGTSTTNNSRLLVGGTVSGATLSTTRAVHINPTLLATGNTTTLIGLDIQPTFTPGSFTGLTQLALRVSGDSSITNNLVVGGSSITNTLLAGGTSFLTHNTNPVYSIQSQNNIMLMSSSSTNKYNLITTDPATFWTGRLDGAWGPSTILGVATGSTSYNGIISSPLTSYFNFESTGTIAAQTRLATKGTVTLDGSTNRFIRFWEPGVSKRAVIGHTDTADGGHIVIRTGDATTLSDGTQALRIFQSTQNVFVGSSTTDLGFKLSVSGSTLLRGSGTTSASYALATQNSSGGTTMVVNNAGNMLIGTTTDAGYRLDVNGTARVTGVVSGGDGSNFNGIYFYGGGDRKIKPGVNQLDITDSAGTSGFQVGGGGGFPRVALGYDKFDFVRGLGNFTYSAPSSQSLTLNLNGQGSNHQTPFVDIVAQGYAPSAPSGNNTTLRIYTTNTTSGVYGNIIIGHDGTTSTGNVLIGTNTNNNSRLLVGGIVSGATLNTTRGVHVSPTLLATGNTTTLIGLDIQPTFTPGSFTGLTQIALRVSGGTQIIGSGSTGTTLSLFSVDGASGRLFDVTDDFTNSLFSVNTSSGVPVIEAFANNSIVMGTYGSNALVVSGTSVSVGTSTSNSTSVLNIVSTTKGVQFPRMTTAQKNSLTGAADILGGLVVFDTNTNKLCCYNGTTWNDLF